MATLYQPPTQDSVQYTLDSQLAQGASSLTLNQSVTGIVQAPGVGWVDRIDANNVATPTKREYFSFTGVSGANLTGLTRGLAGSTDQVHAVGAIVEFGPDVVQAQAVYNVITTEHTTTGLHASLPSVNNLRVYTNLNFSGASINGAIAGANLASGGSLFVKNISSDVYNNLQGAFEWSRSGALVTSLITLTSNTIPFSRATKNQTINSVWMGVSSAPSVGLTTVDINWASGPSGTWQSIFSTKPTIDVGEYTTDTAATPAVLALTSLASGILLRPEVEITGGAGDLTLQLITKERA